MPKRQKLYLDRKSILSDIDRALRRHRRIMTKAEGEEAAMLLMKEANDLDWKKHEEEKDLLLAKADRLKATRLKKLQNLLAAFDTQPLGVPGYEVQQVTLEKI